MNHSESRRSGRFLLSLLTASYGKSQVWRVGIKPWSVDKNDRVIIVAAGDEQPARSEEVDTVNAKLPWWLSQLRICQQCSRPGFNPWVGKIPWRKEWQPTPVFLPGESHGQRSLVGYSPWGPKETEQLNHQQWLLMPFVLGDLTIQR